MKAEADEIICWLTGYSREELAAKLEKLIDELDKGKVTEKILRK